LFQPASAVQYQLEQQMLHLGIHSGSRDNNDEYAVAHVRAYYGNHPIPDDKIGPAAVNAVNCASQLLPGKPIVFLSDSAIAVREIRQLQQHASTPYAHNTDSQQVGSRSVVRTLSSSRDVLEPLHLDKAESTNSADYIDIFVDLLIMANAQCISHGQGGFGRFGVLLSRNPSCFTAYIHEGQFIECRWNDGS
jgi:hypothetical protein